MTSLHPYRSLSRREINLAHSFPSRSIRYQQHGLRKHRPPGGGDDEDDEIGDDLSTHSARKLYEKNEQNGNGRRNGNGGGGWMVEVGYSRQTLGAGSSLELPEHVPSMPWC